jgi:hypothetical protein
MAAYAVQEAEKFMLKIINGNLLDSDCQYIAHQCNCHSLRVGERGVSVILYRLGY